MKVASPLDARPAPRILIADVVVEQHPDRIIVRPITSIAVARFTDCLPPACPLGDDGVIEADDDYLLQLLSCCEREGLRVQTYDRRHPLLGMRVGLL